ncbi:unnamed protein product [Didymodactylos carnosus]|uniref:Fe2OG dioxygenase domain-containing protein n=1 Tax=Didymodactylos carnosus TaxID=1234261 RepID=A0A814M909_9BILA|nr:unnamed protein product [Didymodactylos carnosus]CAF1237818.1 unnamed protein product [Didymodactylos carnosus]CAF3841663.1 unnamed protein product [Didymodactylos carnosus]CAF4045515.1 unnamed protein product [Didymodactylos carnosus]
MLNFIIRIMTRELPTTFSLYLLPADVPEILTRLKSHGLNDLQSRMFTVAKEYFSLPRDEKLLYPITKQNEGYISLGQEKLDTATQQNQAGPKLLINQKECYNILKRTTKNDVPMVLRENFPLLEELRWRCYSLCMQLLKYLATGFEINENYFTDNHDWSADGGDLLQLLHNPPTDKTAIRAGMHSDYGSFTLVFQRENESGLQVFDHLQNEWYNVEPCEDMCVVNTGDMLEYWTNGFVKSTIHRVMPLINNQEKDRYSIAFFSIANNPTLLTPIKSKFLVKDYQMYQKDEHAKDIFDYENRKSITAGEHLQMRLNRTYK